MRVLLALLASSVVVAVLLALEAAVIFMMMVALNGFSGRQAGPAFVVVGLLALAVNFGALLTVDLALLGPGPVGGRRWLAGSLLAGAFALLPPGLGALGLWLASWR